MKCGYPSNLELYLFIIHITPNFGGNAMKKISIMLILLFGICFCQLASQPLWAAEQTVRLEIPNCN